MPDPQQAPEVVIVAPDGTEHVFPPGFDPKRAAAIVRGKQRPGSTPLLSSVNSATSIRPVTIAEKALNWLPAAGGMAGGLIGGAGGTVLGIGVGGVPGAMGGAAVGGAGGEALRQLAMRAIGGQAPATPLDAAKQIGIQGATQAGAEVGGRALAAGARGLARPMMENAIRPPVGMQREFPNIVDDALKNRIPVGRALPNATKGSEQAAAKRAASARNTAGILAEAENAGVKIPTSSVTASIPKLRADVAGEEGLSDAEAAMVDRLLTRFLAKRAPNADLSPVATKEIKRVAQAIAGPVYKAQQKGNPVTAAQGIRARFNKAIAGDAKTALENMPGGFGKRVAESEARTQSLIGVTKAVRQAEMRRLPLWSELGSTATGGAVAQMAGGNPKTGAEAGLGAALLFRVLTSPRSVSRLALAASAPAVQRVLRQAPRAAIVAYLTALGNTEPEQVPR